MQATIKFTASLGSARGTFKANAPSGPIECEFALTTTRNRVSTTTTENHFNGVGWFASSVEDVRAAFASSGVEFWNTDAFEVIRAEVTAALSPHFADMTAASREDRPWGHEFDAFPITISPSKTRQMVSGAVA